MIAKKIKIVLFLFLLGLSFFVNESLQKNILQNKIENMESRKVFEEAMEFVKEKKPTPPVAAIFYAEVAEEIFERPENLPKANFPATITKSFFEKTLKSILEKEKNLPKTFLQKGNEQNEYWAGENPFSPNISKYERYFINENFKYKVAQPPKYKSEEFYTNLEIVKEAAKNRTGEQGAMINFYGGVPGTETPAGIWQNILWNTIKNNPRLLVDLETNSQHKYQLQKSSDLLPTVGQTFSSEIYASTTKIIDKKDLNKKYAYIQMILAQSLADSFLECWKIKYIYQTKRPSMTDASINLAMNNPPFPSYVSGHSTISATAAAILGHFLPSEKQDFLTDAENAKNSRLWAGIHFPYDNEEGYKLGEEIGKHIINKID